MESRAYIGMKDGLRGSDRISISYERNILAL
jgi:hypothetical protein